MSKKIIIGYLIFCIVFFLALIVITAIRVKTRWDQNFNFTRQLFDKINKVSSSLYLSAQRLDSDSFLNEMRDNLKKEERLLLVTVYSAADGIYYLYSKSQDYIESSDRIEAQWKGKPSYQNLPLGSAVVSASFIESADKKLYLDGLYIVFGRDDLFPILKETFIVLFVFFIATCIVVLIVPAGAPASGAPQDKLRPARATPEDRSRRSQPAFENAPAEEEGTHRRDSRHLFSPDTGLGWSDHLPQRVKFEIDRAAATDQDLVLALISLDDFGSIPERDALYSRIAKILLEEFTFQDLAFEYREGSYALIIPDTDLDMGIERLKLFQNRIASTIDLKQTMTLCIGLSSRNGRLVNGATLLTESSNALKRAQQEGKGSLIAFRADPEKYREIISKKL
jgi:GGDEF domain-containing protein